MEGLSLRKVALKARVSATALYSHFRHKRELLAVLATQGFEQLSLAMQSEARAAAGTSDPADFDLPALARGYLNFSLDNAALFQLMFGREVGNLLDFPELVEAGARCYSIMAECVARDLRASGAQLPSVGLGLWKIDPSDVGNVVVDSIDAGYRHFDWACDYGNEAEVGTGLKAAVSEGLCSRDDLWVTSKLWNTYH